MSMEMKILGKVIGECDTWDHIDLNDVQYDLPRFNKDGLKFIRGKIEGHPYIYIYINFDSGAVQIGDDPDDEESFMNINPDWSIFNKEENDVEKMDDLLDRKAEAEEKEARGENSET